MIKHSKSCIREIPILMGLFVGLSLAACHPKPQQQASEQVMANDAKLVERMEKMHARALQAPGGVSEASDFSSSLSVLFTLGVAKRQPVAPTLVDEAVQCLDSAKEAQPDSTADLLVRKGELLLAVGKDEPGTSALRESIAARPSFRAFTLLSKIFAAQKQAAEIEALCKKTLPAMKSEDTRFAVLDDCLKYNGAATPEAGLRWAPSKEVSFYKSRHRELERLKQQRIKDEQKQAKK